MLLLERQGRHGRAGESARLRKSMNGGMIGKTISFDRKKVETLPSHPH
ncbi:hypothetical protein [Burkholderia stabilis]|nr:hypothetical protein [Burkholderia stabilis]HDR9494585.1 hypothetical protein [Burkholderia stabilis]HDR9524301.1 hypothetical protein [Burkholderia stabilis]HDR9541458.1 hypothetical protein [Burkholderia stabilis]HDR9571274.1 hypothetical protein [Burkholderia stabilis]HDR9579536.1 hypothetical protein [Burkholderia stabilis]